MSRRPVQRRTEPFEGMVLKDQSIPLIQELGTSYEIPRAYAMMKADKTYLKHKDSKHRYELQHGEHTMKLNELADFDEYKSSVWPKNVKESPGLTSENARQILSKNGKNTLKMEFPIPYVVQYLKQFGLLPLLMLLAGTLSFANYFTELYVCITLKCDVRKSLPFELIYVGVIVYICVIVTTILTYIQEKKDEMIMRKLNKLVPPTTRVVRSELDIGGDEEMVPTKRIVQGEIVKLAPGSFVPADVRLIFSEGLLVDTSVLTGSLNPTLMQVKPNSSNELASKNLVFFGSKVMKGNALGVVVATGNERLLPHLVGLAYMTRRPQTPLQQELKKFVRIMSALTVILGIVFSVLQAVLDLKHFSFENLGVFICGIILANVPEGLLSTLAVGLILTARKLRQRNIEIQNYDSVETLGSASVICTDKTGVLTKNEMAMSHVYFDDSVWKCKQDDKTEDEFDHENQSFQYLSLVGCLCNRARKTDEKKVSEDKKADHKISTEKDQKVDPDTEEFIFEGDALEIAILKFFERVNPGDLLEDTTIEDFRKERYLCGVAEESFTSEGTIHVAVHQIEQLTSLLAKGTLENVLKRCEYLMFNRRRMRLTDEWWERIVHAHDHLCGMGERVIACAIYPYTEDELPPNQDDGSIKYDEEYVDKTMRLDRKDLTFVGLMSFKDPPRDGVRAAVKTCRKAGVKVFLITGDHPKTAVELAKETGIVTKRVIGTKELFAELERKRVGWQVKEEEIAGLHDDLLELDEEHVNYEKKTVHLPVSEEDDEPGAVVVVGEEMREFDDTNWDDVLESDEIVFARTFPSQKLEIVRQLQRKGEIVAMTGDGVDDSPALKKAELGISMGGSGSYVAKHASDMILMDDNFCSIVGGIEEGRVVFDNLKRSICYTLGSNAPQILLLLLFAVLGIPLPITNLLILIIDLGTDFAPAVSLMFEKPEYDLMTRPPRNPTEEPLLSSTLIGYAYFGTGAVSALAAFFSFCVVMGDWGFPLPLIMTQGRKHFWPFKEWEDEEMEINPLYDLYGVKRGYYYQMDALNSAQTAVFVAIIVTQFASLMTSRTRKASFFQQSNNAVLWIGMAIELLVALVTIYLPGWNKGFLDTRPIHARYWLLGLPFAIIIFVGDEWRKLLMRLIPNSWFERYTKW